MPPKGKSKALAAKHSYLGQFTKNARNLEEMKLKIEEQERLKADLQRQSDGLHVSIKGLKESVSDKQVSIKKLRRRLSHKDETIAKLAGSINFAEVKLKRLRPLQSHFNTAFSISKRVKINRRRKPSSKELPRSSLTVRRAETFQACSAIHGVNQNIHPLVTGMMDTLTSRVKSKDLAKHIMASKPSLVAEVEQQALGHWRGQYYNSRENLLRSLNVYYSHSVMGKAKYKKARKCNRSKAVPNFVPYDRLSKFIREIDIGLVENVQQKYGYGVVDEDPADGVCRPLKEYVFRLAEFYLIVNEGRKDKMLQFPKILKKDPDSILFAMALGGDGAPGTGTSILLSFLNVAHRIASSAENYLLFGANVSETATVVRRYIYDLIKDVKYLESKVHSMNVNEKDYKIEFKLSELPNDMKMLCFLGGELNNNSYYFSTFADVNKGNSNDFSKKMGTDWNPFPYEKRIKDAKKAQKKEQELTKGNTKKETQRSNLTSYISKTLRSRQCEIPLVGEYINLAKSEPLHLKNNILKEMFLKLIAISTDKQNLYKFTTFKDVPENTLFRKFLMFVKEKLGCNFLSKKVSEWFNDTKGKLDSQFGYRFRGKESAAFLKNFPCLIEFILRNVSSEATKLTLHRIHFQFVHLRIVISNTARVNNFDQEQLKIMENSCKILFKSCCLTENKVTPSFWTICNAAPYHAQQTLTEYNLGLGVNTMEGREQKHQSINRYSRNTTFQDRWPMIFRHEFIQLIYLRKNGFDTVNYLKKHKTYLPEIVDGVNCKICGFNLKNEKCFLCDSSLMRKIQKEVEDEKF